jgi:hypothetical protein
MITVQYSFIVRQPIHTNQQVITSQGKYVNGRSSGKSTHDELTGWYDLCHLSFGPSG